MANQAQDSFLALPPPPQTCPGHADGLDKDLAEGEGVSFTRVDTFRVRCDWESDNAGCGIPLDIHGENSEDVFSQLRALGWRVDVIADHHLAKTYCPDCKGSVK